ncbi:4-hydroxy-tetrahydrodipicolinate synthase [Arboricoccus pini]|uniref:4-hydroxy-tetrahydrodipicolinate synthase n=1 Tax=Arboricoccus pini TaxID=1963835 RepID=A0A212PZT7_9PROT|nr:dihydrodipicolinate synthase family protein [Arboricoccus pini]SNB52556.1 4-hydroxy-tetrahydrodipicolinate synthase [Arboricoccus pini]
MAKLSSTARGVYIIAATPFDDAGRLDLESTSRLCDWYLEHGVDGMTILGQMGEAPKLLPEESARFVRHVLDHLKGRIPVIVGVTAPGLGAMKHLADIAMEAGAAGVMVAAPGTLRTDESIEGYFGQVAKLLGPDTPWVLQDFPLSGTAQITAKLIRRVADAAENCVMLKHEDWPGLDKITALRRMEAEGARRLSILTGNGGLFLPLELGRGADGAMTGFAFPEMLVGVCRLMAAGEADAAMDLFDTYLPLVRYEQQPGIGLPARKYILAKRGAIASPALRAPAPPLSAETKADLDWLIERLDRRLAKARG